MDDENAPVWDSGDGGDVVTITAPVHTLNWSLVAVFLLGAFWLYNSLSSHGEDDDED